jgi:hypothetical protein
MTTGPKQAVAEWLSRHGVAPGDAEYELKSYDEMDAPTERLDFLRGKVAWLAAEVADDMPRDEIVRHLMLIQQGIWRLQTAVDPKALSLTEVMDEWTSRGLPPWTLKLDKDGIRGGAMVTPKYTKAEDAARLLAEFRAIGAEVRIDGDLVRVVAIKGKVTDDQIATLKQCKAEFVRLLSGESGRQS